MIPAKEKAKELVTKFCYQQFNEIKGWYEDKEMSKEFALIAVDEILAESNYIANPDRQEGWKRETLKQRQEYWQSVKTEINNL